jgi:NAD(P)-dependent dehydrogenase (short-subunit alcohol dehydrogenase family)
MPRDLHGRRVLITGASSGVGVAAARSFARAGADVALLARSEQGLARAQELARGHGARTLVLPADLADAAAVQAAVDRVVAEWGGVDVVVSNAAAMVYGPFTEVAPRDFERTLEVTFLGAVNLIRAALPHLERTSGVVVVVSSINGKAPLPAFSSYSAAKHALRDFVRPLRMELKAQGSRVTLALVNPGAIDTPIWRNITTATGRVPRVPPEGYRASVVADALVATARNPVPEATIGAEAKLFEVVWTRLGPLSDLVLWLVFRYYETGRKAPHLADDALWHPAGDGSEGGPMLGRPSLTTPLRFRLRRLVRG